MLPQHHITTSPQAEHYQQQIQRYHELVTRGGWVIVVVVVVVVVLPLLFVDYICQVQKLCCLPQLALLQYIQRHFYSWRVDWKQFMIATWALMDGSGLLCVWVRWCVGWCVAWLVPPPLTPPTTSISLLGDARQCRNHVWCCLLYTSPSPRD